MPREINRYLCQHIAAAVWLVSEAETKAEIEKITGTNYRKVIEKGISLMSKARATWAECRKQGFRPLFPWQSAQDLDTLMRCLDMVSAFKGQDTDAALNRIQELLTIVAAGTPLSPRDSVAIQEFFGRLAQIAPREPFEQ